MIVSQRKLLEWAPSLVTSRVDNHDIRSAYRAMWIAPLLALCCLVTLTYFRPWDVYAAVPMLALWFLAPAITWRMSTPEAADNPSLCSIDQYLLLHRSARKIWSFFEQFVTAEDNWLPPDNYQEQPVAVLAHRTSPTNLGLALLANLAAYDFGYIASGELLQRCKDALATMDQLERYRGHFFNWYDTVSLLPLSPRYVSTVDSGNLIGHLLVLRQGLLALPGEPLFALNVYEGLRTTVRIIRDLPKKQLSGSTIKILEALTLAIEEDRSLSNVKSRLDELADLCRRAAG